MFLPENQKKLTNVSIITLKKYGLKFELAVFPNKIYEYRHNPAIPLSSILHSEKIYRSVDSGEIASENDLSHFQKSHPEIIREILAYGHEQKASATSQHELEQVEKQIVEMVQGKVLYNNSYVCRENLLAFIRKIWNIKNGDPKKQVSGIIKKLEEIGFKRVSFKVEVDPLLVNFDGVEKVEDGVIVKSDILPEFLEYCEREKIKFVVRKHEGVEEEDIC